MEKGIMTLGSLPAWFYTPGMPVDRASVGVGVIVRKGGDILQIKRQGSHGAGTWSVPGGHIDFGETVEQCAAREVLEETGVIIREPKFLGYTNDVFTLEGKHYITLWVEAEYAYGEPSITSPRETMFVGWLPAASLPTPRFVPFQNFLDGKLIRSAQHEVRIA